MKVICRNIKRTSWPCSVKDCHMYDDCVINYTRQKTIREALRKKICDFIYRTGHYPAAILAETTAFSEIMFFPEVDKDEKGVYRWGDVPLVRTSYGEQGGVYLIDSLDPVLVIPED